MVTNHHVLMNQYHYTIYKKGHALRYICDYVYIPSPTRVKYSIQANTCRTESLVSTLGKFKMIFTKIS